MADEKLYNPSTGQERGRVQNIPFSEAASELGRVAAFAEQWRDSLVTERASVLEKLADLLEERARPLAELMGEEMGKLRQQGESEAEKCAWVCRYYAEHAQRFLEPEPLESEARESVLAYEPLGVVFAVMPWNFPFWQLFRAAAPAVAAGNALLLKHASNVPGCSAAIAELFADAGAPDLLASVRIDGKTASKIIEDPRVAGVTLTGSEAAGRAVAAAAGGALKPVVLELGGSDPYLVLEDADVDLAADKCVQGRMVNSGQSCIAAKRWIVVQDVHEAFRDRVVERMEALKIGAANAAEADYGPLARVDLRDELHTQVRQSVMQGAKLLCGGEVPDREGYFYPATVLDEVKPGMPAFDEETFGPVGAIVPARDEEEAIHLANATSFGLGGAIFSRDTDRARHLALHRVRTGTCVVNDFVRSDPRLPFGGIRQSGFGRELGRAGIHEFVNRKTVSIY